MARQRKSGDDADVAFAAAPAVRRGRPYQPLRLRAEDAEDLDVFAACLQDALVKVGAMAFEPRRRRFALMFSRYRWEAESAGRFARRLGERVGCGVHFDGVLRAQMHGFGPAERERVLELLTIGFEPGDEGAGRVTLVFAGDAALRLEVECIDARLRDLGQPWTTRNRPRHQD